MKAKKPGNNRGFTIVELMIALTVLSLILLLGTTILVQIGKLYTKGVNAATLQNSTRTVAGDIGSTLQFSGGAAAACDSTAKKATCFAKTQDPVGDPHPHTFNGVTVYSFCIDTVRYSYVLDKELGYDSNTNQTTAHVLWRDVMKGNTRCEPLNITENPVKANADSVEAAGTPSKGYEMIPDHIRLTRFKIVPVPPEIDGNYNIDIWTAFGDSDLVNTDHSLDADANLAGQTTCNGGEGSQFCSISRISTTVGRRLNN
jgi:prepilin-type N-terminal cleavage/methylation domain-containing protein